MNDAMPPDLVTQSDLTLRATGQPDYHVLAAKADANPEAVERLRERLNFK